MRGGTIQGPGTPPSHAGAAAARPLRIGLLSYEYPPETGFGGIGSYTWHHARALVELGHEVHVLAGARAAMPLRSTVEDGVHVHRFWAGGPLMSLFERFGRARLWWTRQRLQNAWSMNQGARVLHDRFRFDLLEMPECGAEGALLTRRLNVPTVVRLHSPSNLIMPFYDVRPADVTWCSKIESLAMGAATALTSCSAFLAGEVAGRMGVTRPIHVVPNGIDLPWFDGLGESGDVYAAHGLPRRRLMIVFTGRLERRKGIHLCPEIAGTILERHDVTFVLAGADLFDYAKNTLLPAVAARRLKGSIHCLGAIALSDVRQLVSAAGIFLLPSVWENCPYSVLEAMAAGKAVVAADQGGVPEMITNGTQGLLARAGDPAAFVAALERLIADEPLRHRLGTAARARVEQEFAHTTIAAQSVELYRRVMARKAAS